MASIFRSPLFAGRDQRRPDRPNQWSAPNLLVSTLVVAALPFSNASAYGQVQHPSHTLSCNDDTSYGTPKTLTADAAIPFSNPPQFLVDRQRPAFDTSRGTPKTLVADAVSPVFNAPWFAPIHPHEWRTIPADTSRSALALGVPTPPTFNAPQWLLPKLWWQPADSSAGIPKPLTADSVKPAFDAPGFSPAHPREQRSVNPDTCDATPLTLFPVTGQPIVNPPQWSPPKFWWQPADTSASVPKQLYADSVAPQFNPPQSQVDKRRPVADTSAGSPQALTAPVQAPFVNAPQHQVDRLRPVADTSQGAPRALLSDIVAPFINAPHVTPDPVRPVADTSQGTPKVLYADSVNPTFNAPTLLLDRCRPVVDESQGLNLPLVTFNPPPPFAQTDWPAPIAYRHLQVHGWDQQAQPGLIPAATTPPVVGFTLAEIAEAVWQREIEPGFTAEQMLRIIFAAVSGTTSGVGTLNEKYKSVDGLKNRIDAIFDGDSNRISVTRDGT